MNISLDFDGVICKQVGIPTIKNNILDLKPVENALDAVNYLLKSGHKVWISTSNPDLERVRVWLEKNNFPKLEVTNIKKMANIYIDDRAIRFTNWQDIRKYFG